MNPLGRPPSANPRTTRKQLCLTADEETAQLAAAEAEDLTWSAWIVRAAGLVAFDEAWRRLAVIGACGSFGGAEYSRVCVEWRFAERGEDLDAFIRRHASRTPLDHPSTRRTKRAAKARR